MFLIHRFSLLKLFRENSVTRLGDILKFRMKYFVSKVAQMYSDFWAILKNIPFQIKTALATFWLTFGKIWATFNFSIWSHRGNDILWEFCTIFLISFWKTLSIGQAECSLLQTQQRWSATEFYNNYIAIVVWIKLSPD